MPLLYVATSKNLSNWAFDVGLTKFIYKIGIAEGKADKSIAALNDHAVAGEADWKLVKKQPVEAVVDEQAIVERLATRERLIDPAIYPKIKGARGIFKVKITNVANHMMISRALAGEDFKVDKVKPADVADYFFKNVQE